MALDGAKFDPLKGSYKFGKKEAEKDEKKPEEKEQVSPQVQRKEVEPEKVLDYMAAWANPVAPKTINPSKHVDSASEARIAEMMARFEKEVEARADVIRDEFPQASAAAVQALALKQVETLI
jgi:hypothetical protein